MARIAALQASAAKINCGIPPISADRPAATRLDWSQCIAGIDYTAEIKSSPTVSAEDILLAAIAAFTQSNIASSDEQPCLALP